MNKGSFVICIILVTLSFSHNAFGKEIQLTCHSLGQKGLNEIVFNIDLKNKKMKLAGLGEELKVAIFDEDFIVGFIKGNTYFNKRYYSINRKSGTMKSAECAFKNEGGCLLNLFTSIGGQEVKKCEVIKGSLF